MKNTIGCIISLVFAASALAEPLLEGRVWLDSGEPVADAEVRIFDLSDLRQGAIARATTDGTGYFALPLAALTGQALPERFFLGQNYPNPFNSSTIIPYRLATSSAVRLEVFNLLGQRIATLVDEERPAGFHSATWHATDGAGRAVGAGMYIYRMTVGVERQTGRMVLVDGQAGLAAGGTASVMPGASGIGGSAGEGEQVYGLIVSGSGLAPYVDSSFRVEAGMAPMELVVSSGHSGGKAADDDCAFCDLFDALHDDEEGPGPSGKAQAALAAPPAPTNLRFEAVTDSSCRVRWDAAAGATDYDVNYKPAVGGKWTNEPHRGIRLYNTIYDLEPNTEYRWAARAENRDGASAWVFGPNFTTLSEEEEEPEEEEEQGQEEAEETEEEEETDSTSSPGSDLIVQLSSKSDSPLTPGQFFTLVVLVRNQGDGQAAATTLTYYRSTDATISVSDTKVGTDAVDALAETSGFSIQSIRLTAPSSGGTYYYGACAASVAGESNIDNNCSSSMAVTVRSGSSPVTIPDANLRAAIVAALGKASGATIYKSEMETLSELEQNTLDGGISDLTGLEFATNLRQLWLAGNNISDISPLSGLTNLRQLWLADNNISDISPLAGLTKLLMLDLSDNDPKDIDISPLSGLTNLSWLDFSGNNISDISPLASLTNLTQLWLAGNNISDSDISPLSGLTKLIRLSLSGNNISDISPLSGLTNLRQLWLSGNNISDISPLASLTNLSWLDFSGNNISDISPLASLTNLTWLWLAFNNLTDVSPLRNLANLKLLDLRGTSLNASSINDHFPALERSEATVILLDSLRESDFDIELVFLADFTQHQKRMIEYAARRWMSIIREDLPDYTLTQGWSGNCGDHSYKIPAGERVDDLRIYITSYFDGRNGAVGGWASPRVFRETSHLTVVGCMGFNSRYTVDINTALHEIGHVLGVGTLWDHLGFLQNPSWNNPNADTHFNGPLAIAAFNKAGGRNYTGAKVPVEKKGRGAWSHWRSFVFSGELMDWSQSPRLGFNRPLSAITIQSLADLGYSVDVTQADPYTLPDASAKPSAKIAASSTHAQPEWSCGTGQQQEPIYVVDPQGRIVRTISP